MKISRQDAKSAKDFFYFSLAALRLCERLIYEAADQQCVLRTPIMMKMSGGTQMQAGGLFLWSARQPMNEFIGYHRKRDETRWQVRDGNLLQQVSYSSR